MAEGIVEGLEKKLVVLIPILEQKVIEIDQMVEIVEKDTAIAKEEEAKVAVDKEKADRIAAEAGAIAKEANDELAVALPALDRAMTSVKNIKEGDITELKALGKPPLKVV